VKADRDEMDNDLKVARDSLSILNKMTLEMFEKLTAKWMALPIETPELLKKIVDQLFEVVLTQQHFAVVYAKFCKVAVQTLDEEFCKTKPAFAPKEVNGKLAKVQTFKRILLTKCQDEYRNSVTADSQTPPPKRADFPEGSEGDAEMAKSEESYNTKRKRVLGNIRFVGELFKEDLLSETILWMCLKELLQRAEAKLEVETCDSLVDLLSQIGKKIDSKKKNAKSMNDYFRSLKALRANSKLEVRIKFKIDDLHELRSRGWNQRENLKTDGPMKISEVHNKIAREDQEK